MIETHTKPAARPPLIEAIGVSKQFIARRSFFGAPIATVNAVDAVSLSLHAGEILGLVGESGCGKSTLGRVLMHLIEPTSGKVWFDGRDLSAVNASQLRALRRQIQLIFQDPFASLNPRMTVGEAIAEPLVLHDLVPKQARVGRVEELLRRVGLKAEHASRYPHEFSGGQRQRIVIARALASEPKVIICDEPVSALDVSVRAQVLNLLRDLQVEFGLALIFISHDLAVVHHIADHVAVMYLGRIVEQGPAELIFASPRHPYTRALMSAIPEPTGRRQSNRIVLAGDVPSPLDPPPGCHFHRRCHFVEDACSKTVPKLEPTNAAGTHVVACPVSFRNAALSMAQAPRSTQTTSPVDRLIAAFENAEGGVLPAAPNTFNR